MSTAPTPVEIEYPESDGKPMGETDLHIYWIIRLRDMLKWRYRDQRTYVAADLLVYYEEGNPRRFVVPDVFVVKNCDPGPRRTYKIWQEPSPPQVVIEVTSLASKRQDTVQKPRVYDEIGVKEYFVYDPTTDYLNPSLRGFRRTDDRFRNIERDADGWLTSEVLNVRLRLENDSLALYDRATGKKLLTEAESMYVAREQERAAREQEQAAREAAEAEAERLRKKLRKLGHDESSEYHTSG